MNGKPPPPPFDTAVYRLLVGGNGTAIQCIAIFVGHSGTGIEWKREGGGCTHVIHGRSRTTINNHLHPGSHAVVRDNVLGDVFDGAEGVLHEVGSEIDVALDHGGDFVDDRHAGLLDQFLRAPRIQKKKKMMTQNNNSPLTNNLRNNHTTKQANKQNSTHKPTEIYKDTKPTAKTKYNKIKHNQHARTHEMNAETHTRKQKSELKSASDPARRGRTW